ncbi:PilT/PilU family type 4a pilus ATPase [Candidatus Gracilibacteria bacterium]|nr:PilT/PilU family type 4a pilus ATPase [Candidatus Gracilibacteria bacterium]
MLIIEILNEALNRGASDIILATGSYPSLKIDGEIVYLDKLQILDKDIFEKEIMTIMSDSQKTRFLSNLEQDFSIDVKGLCRFRVNAFFQRLGYGMVFRPIKNVLPNFEELGLPHSILNLTGRKNGIILVTGSVGAGKSTTLASFLNHINNTRRKHIITIEDPIEFVYQSEKSLIEQREVGLNTTSFENGLKYALRQASDVIMVGEMRDLDTFRLALRAAETGNLVLATLHTSGTARTVSRIIDMFPADERDQITQQISESLIGVIWQDLLKRADGKGRVAAVEILVNTTSIANMIRKGTIHQINSAIETGAQDGMITMNKYLEFLYNKGIITEESYRQNLKQ